MMITPDELHLASYVAGVLTTAAARQGARLWRTGRLSASERESYEDEQYDPPAEEWPAYPDDDYPSSPPLGGPLSAGTAPQWPDDSGQQRQVSESGGLVSESAADGPGGPYGTYHALAATTAGETVTEELERLESRTAALYAQLADEAVVALESGALAVPEWVWPPFPFSRQRLGDHIPAYGLADVPAGFRWRP